MDLNIQFLNYASPGLTVEELIGTPIYTLVGEDRQAEIKGILERPGVARGWDAVVAKAGTRVVLLVPVGSVSALSVVRK